MVHCVHALLFLIQSLNHHHHHHHHIIIRMTSRRHGRGLGRIDFVLPSGVLMY